MAGLVTTLAPGGSVSAAGYFAGPWRDFSHVQLAPQESRSLVGDGAEMAVFVLSGSAVVDIAGERVEFTEGCCATVGLGSRMDVTAGDSGIELFVTTVNADVDVAEK